MVGSTSHPRWFLCAEIQTAEERLARSDLSPAGSPRLVEEGLAMSQDAAATVPSEAMKVLEQLPDGVMVLDDDGRILFANKPGARLVKMKPKRALGQTFPYLLEDGPMRDFDVELQVGRTEWAGEPATILFLKSLKSGASFQLEWKLEAALERARVAEESLANLQRKAGSTEAEPADQLETSEALGQLQQELASRSVELEQLGERFKQGERDFEEISQRLQEREATLNRLEIELEELRAERARSEAQRLEQQRAETEKQRAVLTEKDQRIEELTRSLTALQDSAGEAQREAAEHAERLEAQRLDFEDRLSELESLLETAEAKNDDLLPQGLADDHEVATELQQALASARDAEEQLRSLEDELSESRERVRLAEEQAEVAEERAYQLELEIARLEEEFEGATKGAEELQEALEGQLDQASQQDDKVSELQARARDLGEQLERAQLDKETFHSELEQARQDLEAAFVELEHAAEQEAQLQTLREQSQAAEAHQQELEGLRKEVLRLEKSLQRTEELAEEAERAEKLERQLQGALRRAEEAEERLGSERAQAEKLKQEMELQLQQATEAAAEGAPVDFSDPVTGLPNEVLLRRYTVLLLRQASRYKRYSAAIALTAPGLGESDSLLRQVAERLSSVVRGSDVLGRFSQDTFVLLLSELSGDTVAAYLTSCVAQRLQQTLAPPFQSSDGALELKFSFGVSLFPHDATSGEQLLVNAQQALDAAQALGGRRVSFFHKELQGQHEARVELDREMREGLQLGQFEVLYQPIVELSTLQVIGVESLVQWHHPRKGVLSPKDFLEVAGRSEAIVSIGSWALQQTFAQAAEWQKSGLAVLVSTNLVKRQLRQADLLGVVSACLGEHECAAERVLIEVPEEVLTDEHPQIRQNLAGLSEIGLLLAVDDYGQGDCSLLNLQQVPTQVLKVSSTVVGRTPEDEAANGFLMSILTSARYLGKRAIATGIETEAQRNWLAQAGCRFGQGAILGTPVRAEQIPKLLGNA